MSNHAIDSDTWQSSTALARARHHGRWASQMEPCNEHSLIGFPMLLGNCETFGWHENEVIRP